MEIFCRRIKQLRIDGGFTQKQFAEKLHTTNSAVCDLEKGRSQPDLQTLASIARFFWHLNRLFVGEGGYVKEKRVRKRPNSFIRFENKGRAVKAALFGCP